MKVTFLGTNGWYDTAAGNTSCVFIETGGEYIILDAGFGFYKAKELIVSEKPVSLFISHLHLDHIIGLHTLPLFKAPQGIDIYMPKREAKLLRSFFRMPFTSPLLLIPTNLRFHDIAEKPRGPFKFEYARLRHPVPCYGYRLSLEGAVVAYCTDTGLCDNLERLAAGADLLITECAMGPGEKGPCLFHLTPEAAARVASGKKAKKLALFHFDPAKYPSYARREEAEAAAKKIFAHTVAAKDGTVINV